MQGVVIRGGVTAVVIWFCSYFCGHDHNMQYIQESTSPVSYFVTGAGHLTDPSEEHAVRVG